MNLHEKLADTQRRLGCAEGLFRGIIALDPSVLDTTDSILEARNFAREEFGLLPDNNYGQDPKVVRAYYSDLEIVEKAA
jgi:hypothetical protein